MISKQQLTLDEYLNKRKRWVEQRLRTEKKQKVYNQRIPHQLRTSHGQHTMTILDNRLRYFNNLIATFDTLFGLVVRNDFTVTHANQDYITLGVYLTFRKKQLNYIKHLSENMKNNQEHISDLYEALDEYDSLFDIESADDYQPPNITKS